MAQGRELPRVLTLVSAAAPRHTSALAAVLLLQALLPLAPVYLARPLIDGITLAVRSGGSWQSARPALFAAGLIALSLVASEILRALSGWLRTSLGERVQDHIMDLVHRKSVEVDLAFYDSPDFFDRLHRARSEASYRPVVLVDALASTLQNAITLCAMLAVLLSFGPWLPLALLVSTLPAVWIVLSYAIRQHEFRLRTTAVERRTWYLDWLLTARECASEVRLFSLGPALRSRYADLRSTLRREKVALARTNALAEFGAAALALTVTAACLGWMLWQTISGAITLGSLALFYAAFNQGLRLMRSLLDNVGQLYYNSLFLGNLFDFLALNPSIVAPPAAKPVPSAPGDAIRFERVTFSYDGGLSPVLRNFSLEIPAGRMVAFVGPNGAGKSTFIKLLCRFYDPQGGRITLDGTDIRNFSPEEWRSRITVLFQEPVRYNATVAENISPAAEADAEGLARAARSAGAEDIICSLPDTYDSLLGRMFLEGSELSGGQWQRIALARAFHRAAPILILDEPTSAMDPWAEADWLDRFRSLSQDRTSLLITHRFTTAMRADYIYVLDGGEIVESGSHDDLIASGGLYAQSWRQQTRSAAAIA